MNRPVPFLAGLLLTALFAAALLIVGLLSAPAAEPETGNSKLETSPSAPSAKSPFNVRTFGAVADGQTKDTAAFQKALDACVAAGGGEVLVPAGDYLLGSVTIGANTTLHLAQNATLHESPDPADYPILKVRFEGEIVDGHRGFLSASKANHIAIIGPGGIIANSTLGPLRSPRAPAVVETVECNDINFTGFFLHYDTPAPRQRTDIWCIHPNFCANVTARDLDIRSQLTNGDGIDVDSCKNVQILHCTIDTGDDAISVKSGRGHDAVKLARPTEDVEIKDCTLGSKYAALGVGTEMSGGIRNIRMENTTITRGVNAIYIKSRTGRGGFIENIFGSNLTCSVTTFLGIDLLDKGIAGTAPVTGPDAVPAVSKIRFVNSNINCTTLVDATKISPDKPLDGLALGNLTGVTSRGISLANITNAVFYGLQFTGYDGDLIRTSTNVQGSGLDNPEKPQAAPATSGP